jgi:hypothetical protein
MKIMAREEASSVKIEEKTQNWMTAEILECMNLKRLSSNQDVHKQI